MAEFSVGQIVFSKSGRDKGYAFVVLRHEGEYVYIADGKLRLLSKPKKKKLKHLQPTNYIDNNIRLALYEKKHILDSDLRKVLTEFTKNARKAHSFSCGMDSAILASQ